MLSHSAVRKIQFKGQSRYRNPKLSECVAEKLLGSFGQMCSKTVQLSNCRSLSGCNESPFLAALFRWFLLNRNLFVIAWTRLTDSVGEFLRIGHRLVFDWGILSVMAIFRQ